MSGFDDSNDDPRDAHRRPRRQGFQRLASLRTGDPKHLEQDLGRQSHGIAGAFENLEFETARRWNVVHVPFVRYPPEVDSLGAVIRENPPRPFNAEIDDLLLVTPEGGNDVPIYLPRTAALEGVPFGHHQADFPGTAGHFAGANIPDMAGRSILIIFAGGSGTITVKPAQGEKMNGVENDTATIPLVGKREFLCITNSKEHGAGPLDGAGWWELL